MLYTNQETEESHCQPRIFSPGGSVFEFPKTNFLFYMKNEENVIARVFNLSGRLVWNSKPEPVRSGSLWTETANGLGAAGAD